ncbi:MAG: hypothetical protein ABSH32_13765 [Bryobacteraceae bacterium]|jgi:hypothetical protein
MANLEILISAGVIAANNNLTAADIQTINALASAEVNALIALKSALGDDFITRNTVDAPNCFL